MLVTFANPSTALLARHAPAFGLDLLAFDIVFPDGIEMCMAIRSLHGFPARRVSFDMTSLAPIVFEHAQSGDLAIVLVGGAPGVAERARDRIAATYPGLRMTGALSVYGNVQDTMRQTIALQPDILICGMGGVRQEAFLLGMRAQGWRGWGFTCGGFLDQLHGRLNYYPRWLDQANLRLGQPPCAGAGPGVALLPDRIQPLRLADLCRPDPPVAPGSTWTVVVSRGVV